MIKEVRNTTLEISFTDRPIGETPLVSICVITYNHASFIKECLDGLLKQEVDFGVEILIHDDASTDSTAEILKAFDLKFPGLFRLVLRSENIFSKLGGGINPRFNYPRSKAKYIALCEGDDYWTDPLKLQKQVDFLDAHDDYVLYGHNVSIVGHEFGSDVNRLYHQDKPSSTITSKDFIDGFKLPTNSIVFRKDTWVTEFKEQFQHNIKPQDKWLYLKLSKFGKVFYDHNVMASYRKHPGGAVGSYENWDLDKHIKMHKNQIDFWKSICKLFFPLYQKEIKTNIAKEASQIALRCSKENQHKKISMHFAFITFRNNHQVFKKLLHDLKPIRQRRVKSFIHDSKIRFLILGSKVKQAMLRLLNLRGNES